jgi:hypothetical protein
MSDLTNLPNGATRSCILATLATLIVAAAAPCVWSQVAQSPASPSVAPVPAPDQPAPQPAAPPPPENPGLINEIGKLFKKSTSIFPALPAFPSFKSPGQTIDDLNAGAKGATDALPQLTTMVKGRMACPVAANGAPDCKTASDRLCQSKGFKEGKSLDTDAAQSCNPKALLSGRKPEEGDCKTENYVTRALCQ